MLRNLTIRNYALIDRIELDFDAGFTTITGETGAGKSIIMGALALVLGGRADTKVIADSNHKSVVEARFSDLDTSVLSLLADRGVDAAFADDGTAEIIVRRELSASGRSKTYVNDCTVTLQTLQLISRHLVDIHSQHANAEVNLPEARIAYIDALADNEQLRGAYAAKFSEYVEARRRLNRALKLRDEAAREIEILRFRLQRLSKLKPKRGELAEIEKRFEMLSDADEIREHLGAMVALLGSSDAGVQTLLDAAAAHADKVGDTPFAAAGEEAARVPERIKNILIEVKDIAETVDDTLSTVNSDPATLGKLSERMNLYYEAMKYFRVKDADELEALYLETRRKVDSIENGDSDLEALEKEVRTLAASVREMGDHLTATREQAAKKFAQLVVDVARPLGLPNIAFEVQLHKKKFSVNGQDEADFLCSFNKNGVLRPVKDVASGGEISRLMLSVKSVLAGNMNLPTIIFDEVDTGVSGEVADKIGSMMRDMGSRMQVMAITHLPQVAAKGENHFKVYKNDVESRTLTGVRKLSDSERVLEIAAMISGSSVTDDAVKAARALIYDS